MTVNINTIKSKIVKGDIKAFEALFHALYAPLCAYVQNIVKRKEIAEEIVQEILYKLWKERKDLKKVDSLKSYIYRSAYHGALHFIEHKKVQQRYYQHQSKEISHEYSPEQGLLNQELYQLYQKTLKELSPKCRMIFLMSRNEDLKYKEIAQKLSISIKTVEANIGKALRTFKDVFKVYQNSSKEHIV